MNHSRSNYVKFFQQKIWKQSLLRNDHYNGQKMDQSRRNSYFSFNIDLKFISFQFRFLLDYRFSAGKRYKHGYHNLLYAKEVCI